MTLKPRLERSAITEGKRFSKIAICSTTGIKTGGSTSNSKPAGIIFLNFSTVLFEAANLPLDSSRAASSNLHLVLDLRKLSFRLRELNFQFCACFIQSQLEVFSVRKYFCSSIFAAIFSEISTISFSSKISTPCLLK